jgi:hypothetical protein
VVLVDFSKSFVPGGKAGLLPEDQHALRDMARQLVVLAAQYMTVKILWFPIEGSAPTDGLCKPLEINTSLVKRSDGSVSRDEVDGIIGDCLKQIVQKSKSDSNLADYTHVSGAISTAADALSGDYAERVLVVLSDFKEDLGKGSLPASFQLSKARVIMLHRPASDEPLNVSGYLARVGSWKEKLLRGGASEVTQMPLFSVSEARLRAALRPGGDQPRTSLSMLVDFKDDVFPRGGTGLPDPAPLVSVGKEIAALVGDWPQPVTAQWIVVAGSGFRMGAEAPVEYWTTLIKPPDLLSDVGDFGKALEETAMLLPSLGRGDTTTDLSGTIDLVSSAEPAPKSHVLVIVSDFVDKASAPSAFHLKPGTRVVMLYKPSPTDLQDPDAGRARRAAWRKRLEDARASVCEFQLASWTSHDLKSCLAERH